MRVKNVDTFIKNNELLNIDLYILKNMNQIIDLIRIYNPTIAHKIEYNQEIEEVDTNYLLKVFSSDFLNIVIENINDDNANYKDNLIGDKLLFIVNFYNDNFNYFYSEYIVDENIDSFEKIYKEMIRFAKDNLTNA